MYYSGMPFVEWNLKTDLTDNESYFEKKEIQIFETAVIVYERKHNKQLVMVVYQYPTISDESIIKYHEQNYLGLACLINEQIGERVIKTTFVKDGNITGYNIIKYDSLWRDEIEQSFDCNMLLVEYRKIYYKDEERVFLKEKIFFAAGFSCSEEGYD